jgi:hypothetical protein
LRDRPRIHALAKVCTTARVGRRPLFERTLVRTQRADG